MQETIAKLIEPGMVVWDLGANVGFYTLAFSRMVGDGGQVVAFEPYAQNVDYLLTHIRINRCDNVVIIQAAVASRNSFAAFPNDDLGNGAVKRVSLSPTGYLVPSVSVDDILNDHPDWSPAVIKIDVEGAGGDVLMGASTLLSNKPPTILLSFHGPDESHQCRDILLRNGYRFSSLQGMPVADCTAGIDTVVAVPPARPLCE